MGLQDKSGEIMELFCFGSMGFQHIGKSYVIAKVKSSTDYCSSDKKPQSSRWNQSSGVEGGTRMWLFQNQSSFSLEESFFLSFSVSG